MEVEFNKVKTARVHQIGCSSPEKLTSCEIEIDIEGSSEIKQKRVQWRVAM